jgi:hypothetical protein
VGGEILEIEFDLIAHRLVCRTSLGEESVLSLGRRPVGDFYRRLCSLLAELGNTVAINSSPTRLPIRSHFRRMRDIPTKMNAIHGCWRALVQVDRVFKQLRSGFLGKASPIHFFWGSFDLAVTRFSGRAAHFIPAVYQPFQTR